MRGRTQGVLFIVVAAAVAAFAHYQDTDGQLFDDDQTYSLCPDDKSSTEVIRDSRMIEEAPAYTGPGPHRIVVDGLSFATRELPEDWVPPRESNGRHRVDTLELVACEYQYAVGDEGDLKTCSYRP